MALTTDDCDMNDVRFYMNLGGNGDYYMNLVELNENQQTVSNLGFRVAMSGGSVPTNVKLAIANLYNEMELAHLNNHPKNENNP